MYTSSYENETTVIYSGYNSKEITGFKHAGDLKVRAMTIEDILRIASTNIKDDQYNMLFVCGGDYKLASAANENVLWSVRKNTGGIHGEGKYGGIRPVVSIKSNIKTTGFTLNGIWSIQL